MTSQYVVTVGRRRPISEISRYRDSLAHARGSASTLAILDRLLAGDESVRDEVERMLDGIDRDCMVDD